MNSEYVIIGAHHDHLGMGGPGTSSSAPDTVAVHYGADDNASGVAGVMEISEAMSASPLPEVWFLPPLEPRRWVLWDPSICRKIHRSIWKRFRP